MGRAPHKPKHVAPIDKNIVLWCPFCEWHLDDSFTTRRRMGSHIGSEHRIEVAFKRGVEPPNLEPPIKE